MTEMEVNTFLWLSGLFCWVGREELHLKARQYLAMKHSEMECRLSQKEELEYYHFPLSLQSNNEVGPRASSFWLPASQHGTSACQDAVPLNVI